MSKWVRQIHRLCVAFTVAVVVNIVAVVRGRYSPPVGLTAVFPLALPFVSGPYMFILPYARRWRGRELVDRVARRST